MHLTKIDLVNWLPFKGQQSLELARHSYAVVASVDGSQGRSNWSGKTAFLEAIPFAIFGIHRKRTEDDWIYDEAKAGSVALHFSNGVSVVRSRERGRSTQLVVNDNGTEHMGSEAQSLIERLIGMSKDDFQNTTYFRQKDIARIVYAKPADRAKEFASWFKLGMLRKSEAVTLQRINDMRGEGDKLKEYLSGLQIGMTQALGETTNEITRGLSMSEYIENGVERLRSKVVRAEQHAATMKMKYDAAVDDYTAVTAIADMWQRHLDNAEKYREIVAELRSLGESDESTKSLEAFLADKSKARIVLEQQLKSKREECALLGKLLVGNFNGVCPVNGMQCPAERQILSAEVLNRKKYDEVNGQIDIVRGEVRRAADEERDAMNDLRRIQNIEKRKVALDTQAKSLRDSITYINDHDEPRDAYELKQKQETAYEAFADADRASHAVQQSLSEWARAVHDAKRAEKRLDEIDEELSILQAAVVVLGRQGAQRVIAERVLDGIVYRGNNQLRDCSIDLEFNITWAREGKGLADVCGRCGFPQPSSQKVKRCPRCDAERGTKTIERSDILFSDRSGAAEDIIGGVIRLEAGSWFKRDRGSPWGVVLVDEPFGALDESNRDAFMRLLLASFEGEQAFIVAHHPDVTSTMPSLVRVVRHDGYSTIDVIEADDE